MKPIEAAPDSEAVGTEGDLKGPERMDTTEKQILIVDPEPLVRRLWAAYLARWGYESSQVASLEEAQALLNTNTYHVLISDLTRPEPSAAGPIRLLKRLHPELEIIVTATNSSVELAVEAMKAGVYEFLVKPINFQHAEMVVRNCLEQARARRENAILRERNRDLEELNELKARFIAVANHELRRPMGLMLITAEMLREAHQGKDTEPLLALLHKAACHLKDQLDKFQEYTEMRSDLTRLHTSPAPLLDLWREVCGELGPALHQHTLSVLNDIPEHLSIQVDRDMFKKALRELLRNAIQYSAEGGVIRAGARDDIPGFFEFSIADTGLGLSEDQQERILHLILDETDVLGHHAAEASPGTGIGLGLSIVHEIAKAHGGSVCVLSNLGKGSTFTLRLPHSVSAHDETVRKRTFSQNGVGRG